MQKTAAKLNDLMDGGMKDYSSNVDSIEDAAVEKSKDLEEEMGQTMTKMMKDLEKGRRRSMQKMKDWVMDFRKEMYTAEEKILQYSRSVAQRPVENWQSRFEPYESPNTGGSGSSSGLQT
eukprot:2046292-Karenia_brevis.AAC.1